MSLLLSLKGKKTHPVALLRKAFPRPADGVVRSIEALTLFEDVNDVVFVALDTEDLAVLRAEFASMQNSTQPVGDRIARDIAALVGTMLDLED